MDLTDQQKFEKAHITINEFTNIFKDDELVNVIMELLYGESGDDISLSGEAGQVNDPTVGDNGNRQV